MRWLAIGGVLVCAIGGAALWLFGSGGTQGALKPPVVAPARARAGTRDEAPDRLSYRSATGDAGVVIGARRWDLVVGGSWKRSLQNPPLALPAVPWGAGAYDVSLLGSGRLGGRAVLRISMFEPTTPAWYTVTLDRSSARTLEVDMTATAHFMHDRYVTFDTPLRIRPPAGR